MYHNYRLKDMTRLVALEDIAYLKSNGQLLIDLRSESDFNRFHIDGFINRPAGQLSSWIHTLSPNMPVYLICSHGKTAYELAVYLSRRGYQAYAFMGGVDLYQTQMQQSQGYF